MSGGIKAYASQKKLASKLDGFTEKQSQTDMRFMTGQALDQDKFALDTIARMAYRVGAAVSITSNSSYRKRVLNATAHGALPGDMVRFETGANASVEMGVLSVPDANTIILAGELPSDSSTGETFYVMRYVTPRTDQSGATLATTGPLQFTKDSVDTLVSEDTTNSANSDPLPVKALSDYLDSARLDYSVDNVDNTNWEELISDTGPVAVDAITLFDGGGFAMELGIGAAASEVRKLLIPPGGFNGVIPIHIPANSRLSIRAVGAALVNAGEICINLMR